MSAGKQNEIKFPSLVRFNRERRILLDQYKRDIENYDKQIQSLREDLNNLNPDTPDSNDTYKNLNQKIKIIYRLKNITENNFKESQAVIEKKLEIEKIKFFHKKGLINDDKNPLNAFIYYFIELYGSQEETLPISINYNLNTRNSRGYLTKNLDFLYDLLLLIFLKKYKVIEAFIEYCDKEILEMERNEGIKYQGGLDSLDIFSFRNIIHFANNHFFEENTNNIKIHTVLQKAKETILPTSYFAYEGIKKINENFDNLLVGMEFRVVSDSLRDYSKWYYDEFLSDNYNMQNGLNLNTKTNHSKKVLLKLALDKESQSILTIGFNDYSLDQEIRNLFPNSNLTKALKLNNELISTLLDLILEEDDTKYKRLEYLNVLDDKFDHIFIDASDNSYFDDIMHVFESIDHIINHLNDEGRIYLKFGENLFEERNNKFRNKLFSDNLVEGLIVLGGRSRIRNAINIKSSSYQDNFLYRKFQPRGGHTFYESARPNAYMVISKEKNDKVFVVHEEQLYESNKANIANSDVVINNFTKLYKSKRKTRFSRYVNIQEIISEEYSLNTSKYFNEQYAQNTVSLNSILKLSKPINLKFLKSKDSDHVIHVLDELDNFNNLKAINLKPLNNLWDYFNKKRAYYSYSTIVVEGPSLLVSVSSEKISSLYISEGHLKKFNATQYIVPHGYTSFKLKQKSKSLVDPHFLSHKLGSGINYREINRLYLGFTFKGFNPQNSDEKLNMQLLDLKIGLPDLAEQLRFVESLGTIAEEWNVKQDSYTKRINDLSNQNVANFLTLKHETGDNRAAIATNTRLLIDFFSSDKNKLILKELDKNFKVEDDDDSILESLNMIKKSITDLSNQLETKKYTTSLDNEILEENSINELEEMFGEFQKKYKKSFQIEFTIDYIQEDLIIAYAKYNYELLKKLFDNLLRNSRDHAFSNYGSKLKNLVSVIITVDADEDSITICYRDNGKGFPDHFTRDDFITLGRSNTGVMGRGEGGANIHEIAKFHENANWQLNRHPNSNFSTEFIFNLKPTFYE